MDPILSALDKQFSQLDQRSRSLLTLLDAGTLYARPLGMEGTIEPFSCGEFIARSAATVERTFGGITTRLWDDPYEWTLPEKLADTALLLTYLDEVEATRLRGFAFFASDTELSHEIPAPERMRPLGEIIVETIALASHYQGRAFAVYQLLTRQKPPRL